MIYRGYRFEFKYQMQAGVAREIAREFSKYDIILDKHAVYDDGSYMVNSLYFDSYKLTDYQTKAGGAIRRKKIRLRTYGRSLNEADYAFLEIKHKDDMMNRKIKIKLVRDVAQDFILNGKAALLKNDYIVDREVKERIMVYFLQEIVKPKIVVAYNRTAFVNPARDLRITLDKRIQTCHNDKLELGKYMTQVFPERCIMEVKFNYIIPFWLKDIIVRHNLQRDTFSKYERSLEALNIYNPLLR